MTQRSRLLLIAAVAAGAAIRVALALVFPLVDDEAHYWVWSRHLAWGYPDHPPVIAGLIALTTSLFGDGEAAIRLGPLLLGSATPLATYLAGRTLFDAATGARAAVLAAILPIFALGTAFAFPDAPLGFFWIIGLWAAWQAMHRGGWWWLLTGIVLGLALLSKLTAAYLVLGLFAVWVSGPWKRSLKDPWWYVGVAVGGALLIPFLVWNAHNGWITLHTTLAQPRWVAPRSSFINLLFFLGGQLGYFGLVAPLLVGACVVATRRFRDPVWGYLAATSIPILATMLIRAFVAGAKPHWPGPGYLTAAVALGALWPAWERRFPRLVRGTALGTAIVTLALALTALLPLRTGLIETLGRWDRLAQAVAPEISRNDAIVLTNGYQAASQLAYHLRNRILVTNLHGAFALWYRPVDLFGRDGLYVDEDGGAPRGDFLASCQRMKSVGMVEVGPRQAAVLYRCEDFTAARKD